MKSVLARARVQFDGSSPPLRAAGERVTERELNKTPLSEELVAVYPEPSN